MPSVLKRPARTIIPLALVLVFVLLPNDAQAGAGRIRMGHNVDCTLLGDYSIR
jgi:hypothetical protein